MRTVRDSLTYMTTSSIAFIGLVKILASIKSLGLADSDISAQEGFVD